MTLLAAALLGLLGSAHCVAMCGPLILAVGIPRQRQGLGTRLLHITHYHAGRLSTYALLGALAGAAGSVALLGGLGRGVAVAAGVALILAGIGPGFLRRWTPGSGPWMTAAAQAGAAARRWQVAHPSSGPFVAGLANGVLPCGMVYAALATALSTGSIPGAAGVMAAFGLGTVPALAGLSLGAAQVSRGWQRRLSHVVPMALVLVGLLMVGRALRPSEPDHSSVLPRAMHSGAHVR